MACHSRRLRDRDLWAGQRLLVQERLLRQSRVDAPSRASPPPGRLRESHCRGRLNDHQGWLWPNEPKLEERRASDVRALPEGVSQLRQDAAVLFVAVSDAAEAAKDVEAFTEAGDSRTSAQYQASPGLPSAWQFDMHDVLHSRSCRLAKIL